MNYNHSNKLSNDFSNLLNDTSNYNVKIKVGEEPNIKEFKAHSLVLSSRSIYFQKAFSAQWAKKEDGIIIFNKPNISPLVFGVLIKYIYTGILSVEDNNVSLVDIVIAADELELLEVYQQLEERLLENESAWQLPKDFITICQHDNFTNLYDLALNLVCKKPEILFKSKEFLKMKEGHLIQVLKCDDLELEEIEIWEYLIKWGIENSQNTDVDLTNWTQMHFTELEKALHNCIPHIRFFQMSPEEYSAKVRPLTNILPRGLDHDVIQYFLNPKSRLSFDVLPLRESKYRFDSKIINSNDAALIASWIDKKRGKPYKFKSLPLKFKLIYRASLEGFRNFHSNCDNKESTVVIIKVRNSGEVIGGYNPLDWRSINPKEGERRSILLSDNSEVYHDHKCETSNSFIFSLTNRAIPILSRVSSKKEAIIWCREKGPCFGLEDLWIQNNSRHFQNVGKSKQHSYEREIIGRETFEIEEYEVFQIIDNRFSFIKFIYRIFQVIKFIVSSIAEFFINVDERVYKKLFLGLFILIILLLLVYLIIIFIYSSILTKVRIIILSFTSIVAIASLYFRIR